MTLFALGILTTLVAAWVGYHIISIVETRLKEKEQWNRILSQPSPSQTYWSNQTMHEPYEDGESITIRPPSQMDAER